MRGASGLNQQEFADRLGYSRPHVAGIESGFKIPSLEFLVALRRVFKADINSLVDSWTEFSVRA